jgi:FkbM family methyltransferase
MIGTVIRDFNGLRRVCGLPTALRWTAKIATHLPQIVRTRRLTAADLAMGEGPVTAWRNGHAAKIPGDWAIAHVREIWVRDVYLHHGFLRIPPGATVVDLGANRGAFTALALASHPNVRVVSVEPVASCCDYLRRMLQINGWEHRAQICHAFVGNEGEVQRQIIADDPAMKDKFLSEDEFVRRYNLERIDLIKCDIEGSEYGLFTPQSRLLRMASQLAIEVHGDPATRAPFIQMLRDHGFDELVITSEVHDNCTLSARKSSRTTSNAR